VALLELATNALLLEEMDEFYWSFPHIQFPAALLDALIILTGNASLVVADAIRVGLFTV
jgi:hypothetical protein